MIYMPQTVSVQLQAGAGLELHDVAGGNLDGLLRVDIPALAGIPVLHTERAEADQRHAVAALQGVGDRLQNGVDGPLGRGRALKISRIGVLHSAHKFVFIHDKYPISEIIYFAHLARRSRAYDKNRFSGGLAITMFTLHHFKKHVKPYSKISLIFPRNPRPFHNSRGFRFRYTAQDVRNLAAEINRQRTAWPSQIQNGHSQYPSSHPD